MAIATKSELRNRFCKGEIMSFMLWRTVHLIAAILLGLLAIVHAGLTFVVFPTWSPDSVWFLGTGLGLLLLAVFNLTHIGIEPCRHRSVRLIRYANWPFLMFGIAAATAIPEPQAFVIVACLAAQAVAGLVTLPGPSEESGDH